MKRRKLGRKASRRMFTGNALKVKTKNLIATPMRGGFRL